MSMFSIATICSNGGVWSDWNVCVSAVASVTLGFRRQDVAHPLDGFGILFPRAQMPVPIRIHKR